MNKSCSGARLGAAISARKRVKVNGHDAGMPRSSRYQLRQPVAQIVWRAASTRSASNAVVAAGNYQQTVEFDSVAEYLVNEIIGAGHDDGHDHGHVHYKH